MHAMTGRRLGAYQVQECIGAGGMGEVYRARDTRLGRDVAIKILPAVFTSDPERLARSEREAGVLAALNHPNIVTFYGFAEEPAEAGPHEKVAGLDEKVAGLHEKVVGAAPSRNIVWNRLVGVPNSGVEPSPTATAVSFPSAAT